MTAPTATPASVHRQVRRRERSTSGEVSTESAAVTGSPYS
jgi:hypothetical protein